MAENKKVLKLRTPKGIARYPWLDKPNTKFNAEGDYTVDLILEGADAEELKAILQPLCDEAFNEAVEECKKPADKKKIVKAPCFHAEEDDETGEETGRTIFKFKNKAVITLKDKSKKQIKPDIFDAKGKAIKGACGMYSGSIIKVNFSPTPFFVAATKQAGITLRLNAVQILELVKGGSGDAGSYGFDEEEGYEAGEGDTNSFDDNDTETPTDGEVDF